MGKQLENQLALPQAELGLSGIHVPGLVSQPHTRVLDRVRTDLEKSLNLTFV